MIAIMKDIEKNQTKPTVAMLYSLFEETEPPKKKLMLEKKSGEEKNEVRYREKKYLDTNENEQWKK